MNKKEKLIIAGIITIIGGVGTIMGGVGEILTSLISGEE